MNSTGVDVHEQPSDRLADRQQQGNSTYESDTVDNVGKVDYDTSSLQEARKNNSLDDVDVTYASESTSSKSYVRSESPDGSSDSGNESQDLIQSDGTPENDTTEEDANQGDNQAGERDFNDQTTIAETDQQSLNSSSGNSTSQSDSQNDGDATDQLSRRAFFNDKLANIKGAPILSEIIKLRNQHTSKLFNGSKIRRKRRRKRKKKFRPLNGLLSDQLSNTNIQKLDTKNTSAINNQLKKAMQTRQSSTANGYSSINSHTGMAEAALLNQFSATPLRQQLPDHHLAASSQTIPNVIKQQFPAMPVTTAMQKFLLGRLALANNMPSQQQQNFRQPLSKLLPVAGGSSRLAAAMLYNSNEQQQQQYAREFFKHSLGLNRDLKGHSLLPYDSLASNTLLKYAQAANQIMPNDEHSSGDHKALIPVEIIGLDPTISDSILQHQQGAAAAMESPAAIVDSQADSTRVFESIGSSNGQDNRFKADGGDSDIVSAVQQSKPFHAKPSSIFHIHHYHHTKSSDNSSTMRKPQEADGTDEAQPDQQSTAIVQASDANAPQTTNNDDSQSQDDGPKPPQQVLVNDKGQLVYVSMNDVDGSTIEAPSNEQDSSEDNKQPAGPGVKQKPRPGDANEPEGGPPNGSDGQSERYPRPSSGNNVDLETGPGEVQQDRSRGRNHMSMLANGNLVGNYPMRPISRHNSSRLMSYPDHHDRFSNSYWHMQADATGTQEQNSPDRPASNKYPLLMVSYKPQQPQHYSNYTASGASQQGLTRKFPYNEGSESKSSLVAATKHLIGTKHLHEASHKLLSQLGSRPQQQNNLSQMTNHDNYDEGGQYLSKLQTPTASGGLLVGPLSNHLDRLNKTNFNLAISNNSESESYNIANNNRVPLLPLPFRSQTIPFVTHYASNSNKTYNPIAASGFGRHYNLFNASVLAHTNQNIPENSVLLKHITAPNTSSDPIGSNATKLTNEELLNLLNHLKHLNGTDSNMKFIKRPNNKLELAPMTQASGNRFHNLKPNEVSSPNQVRGKLTSQSNPNLYDPSNGIDINGNIAGGDIRQLIDNSTSTSLADANGLSNLALAFIFTVSLLTFLVIAASLIYRRRRVANSSRAIEPTTDACSGPYSLNRGRLNLAQRTKHFMRSNFVANSNNSHPTSLKSLNLYDTNNNSDPNEDAKPTNGAIRPNGNLNCKFASDPSGGNNSSGKLFNSNGTTTNWVTKSNKTPKGLSTFGSQSEDHDSIVGCNHSMDHGNGPPIKTLNTRSHQTKQSYLKSLVSSKNNHHHHPLDALDAIKKTGNQVSAKSEKDSLVLVDDDGDRSPSKILSTNLGNSSLILSHHHHHHQNQQRSDKVSYLNIKQHGSNDNCRPSLKTTAEPNSLQDVSNSIKQHPAPTLIESESDNRERRIRCKTDLIINGNNSNELDDYDDDDMISDHCQEVTVERISSPSLTSSFMLQSNSQSPGLGHDQKEAREFNRAKYNRPNRLSTIRSVGFDSFNMKKIANYKRSNSLHEVVKNLRYSKALQENKSDAKDGSRHIFVNKGPFKNNATIRNSHRDK